MHIAVAEVVFAEPLQDTAGNGENGNVLVVTHRISATDVSYEDTDPVNLQFCGVILLLLSVPGLLLLARSIAIYLM